VELPLIVFDSKSAKGRIALAAAVIVVILFAWFAVRWQIGNMLAALTQPNQPNAKDLARLAQRLAPSDALPMWLMATQEKETFSPQSLENAVAMSEEVVRLEPNDLRYWIELGRAMQVCQRVRVIAINAVKIGAVEIK